MSKRIIKLILLAALSSFMFVGCASESEGPAAIIDPVDDGGTGPVSDGTTVTTSSTGNEVDLVIVGSSETAQITNFAKYTGRPMYSPQNIKLYVDLINRGNGNYGGTVKIIYTDNGQTHTGGFINGEDSYYLNDKNIVESARYNKWFKADGQWVFHGFFQDNTGGVIIVLDETSELFLGDGVAPTKYKGSIWYKNFGDTVLNGYNTGPHPNLHCWFVSYGPYDCRAWKSGDGVNTYHSVNPTNGYIKLGTFENLDVDVAFN